jgi:hypothetical protein
VWIDEQFLALQFACNNCLNGDAPLGRAAGKPLEKPVIPAGERRRYRKRE